MSPNTESVLTVLCLGFLLLQSAAVPAASEQDQSSVQISQQTISVNITKFLSKIIDDLNSSVLLEDGNFVGWPMSVDGYDDVRVATGYRIGNVGVGTFLSEAITFNITGTLQILQHLEQELLNQLLTSYKENGDGIYWDRFVNLLSGPWLAVRYGTAGIVPYLSSLNQTYGVDNFGDLLSQAYTWVNATRTPEGDYPMDPGGYITTDIEYGATGVLDSLIKIYRDTLNNSYLGTAIEVGEYLLDRGSWSTDQFFVPWAVPQDDNPSYVGDVYKSITSGIAGSLREFLELYEITNDTRFLDAAEGIGRYLVHTEKNGKWDDCAVDYVGRTGDTDGLVGYDVGSTGIITVLLELDYYMQIGSIDQMIYRVEMDLHNLTHPDGSVSMGSNQAHNRYTGLSHGAAGVAKYYLMRYSQTENENYYNNATLILSHLWDLYDTHGYIPINEKRAELGYGYNIEQGLAGIGTVLLDALEIVPNGTLVFTVVEHISSLGPNSTNTGGESSETFFDLLQQNQSLQIVLGLTGIMIIVLLKKYYQS